MLLLPVDLKRSCCELCAGGIDNASFVVDASAACCIENNRCDDPGLLPVVAAVSADVVVVAVALRVKHEAIILNSQ